MRRTPWIFTASFLLLLGCTRPEVEAFRKQPAPVKVTVSLPARLGERDSFQQEYASALRARLATRVVVVPEGVQPPVGAAELQVEIRDISVPPSQPSGAAVGVATGVAVGAVSVMAGNRGWGVMDGLFWGLWAGSHAAMHRDRAQDRLSYLGYTPQVVRAEVRLLRAGDPEPLWVDVIDPEDVVNAMDPLPPGYREDDGRIREEEAKGFARVVVQKLSAYFQWTRFTEQRFYGDGPQKERTEPPAPRLTAPSVPPPTEPPPPPPGVLPPPPEPKKG